MKRWLLPLLLLCACEALWGGFRAPHAGGDGGTDGGGDVDLGTCGAATCAGCCQQGRCLDAPRFPTCGAAGSTCELCGDRGDRCDANGACSCAGFAACAAGQRCQGNQCLCDGQSCPTGCCRNNLCVASAFPTCGTGGVTCGACDPTLTDRCANNNQCLCGDMGRVCRKEGSEICEAGRCRGI